MVDVSTHYICAQMWFWHEQRYERKDEYSWDRDEDKKQILDREKEKMKGTKERREERRNKLHPIP